jgi:hypothetical protein
MKSWILKQVEWLKSFFTDPNKAHALIILSITAVFLFTFAKEALIFGKDDEIPDMPEHWLYLFLGILGIEKLSKISNFFNKRKESDN